MKNTTFAAIDFETANNRRNSACSLSIVTVRDNEVKDQVTCLIRPPTRRFEFTNIHGIRWKDVQDMPSFDDLWPFISEKLQGVKFIAAHNAAFDRSVLYGCCEHYGLTAPSIPFVCTVQLARKAWNIYPTKLPDVCRKLRIELNHHDAASDALACAQIVIKATSGRRSLTMISEIFRTVG
jgi:DNA polymerase-3 subunit epsilon